MIDRRRFIPESSLFEGHAHPECRASVIVPLRNEETTIGDTLDALNEQVDAVGNPLDKRGYEVLVLLNNCTDGSFTAINHWRRSHPELELHFTERTLLPEMAHVGAARRWLMDTAWHRLSHHREHLSGILSTDSDTRVAPDWISQNLRVLDEGAQAVGGVIQLLPGEIEALPDGARTAYRFDRQYQALVAELEARLDPLDYDPWPRHLEHFGASLAVTPQAYSLVGGLPPVTPLEDVAFVDALTLEGVRLRHDPDVVVFTSARLDGRATVGLSFQLREWQRIHEMGEEHQVASASWLTHRLMSIATLKSMHKGQDSFASTRARSGFDEAVKSWAGRDTFSAFMRETSTEKLIERTFDGNKTESIERAIRSLERQLKSLRKPDRETARTN